MGPGRMRPGVVLLVLLVVLYLSAYLSSLPIQASNPGEGTVDSWSAPRSLDYTGPRPGSWLRFAACDTSRSIPVDRVEAQLKSHLLELQSEWNATEDYEDFANRLDQNLTLDTYTNDLFAYYTRYLSRTTHDRSDWLVALQNRLSLWPDPAALPPSPKQIITSDKTIHHIPEWYDRWAEIMPEWQSRYFGDEQIEKWVTKTWRGSKAQKLFDQLPQRVLQTDIFRYMIMLTEGGIYTDSDTAPIIHADLWGRPWTDITPPAITQLSNLLSRREAQPAATYFVQSQSKDTSAETIEFGKEDEEPGLVISVETDTMRFGWTNWRDVGLARGMQITQWTFRARPGHPVFLDAVGRALQMADEVAAETEEAARLGKEYVPESALELTGPGLFTDCVYRYLLARYGVQTYDLVRREEPVRVGDVLILPSGSYSSVSPFGDEKQRPWAASWHGFLGRWREHDPHMLDLQRQQEEQEAEEQQAEEAEAEVVDQQGDAGDGAAEGVIKAVPSD